MALIELSKGREEGGGYERLFGNQKIGHLLSRVQATVISSGTELEKIVGGLSNNINNVDAFLQSQQLPTGVYLISKDAIKKSTLKSDKEPDLIVFKIDPTLQHCYIIELKDGDTFDTKKAAGEVMLLEAFESHLSRRIRFTTSIHVCSFNQLDKKKIVVGFKNKITIHQAMTGKELCELLGISYEGIIGSRIHQQIRNLDFFLDEILAIAPIRDAIIKKLEIRPTSPT
jgi:hypothetical protein